MITQSVQHLRFLCDTVPPLLRTVSEEAYSFKPSPEQWSKKEILGHLIDSAANNHQRFVRTQFEDIPRITYNQNLWNRFSYYSGMNTEQLIRFWELYNRQLAEILTYIPDEFLSRECNIGKEQNVTLEWIVQDYVRHLEHHVHQIVQFDSGVEILP